MKPKPKDLAPLVAKAAEAITHAGDAMSELHHAEIGERGGSLRSLEVRVARDDLLELRRNLLELYSKGGQRGR